MNQEIPNDFGTPLPAWGIRPTKEVTEDRNSISIIKLRKTAAYEEREALCYDFLLGTIEMHFRKDLLLNDWYLEFTDPGPKNICSAITLVRTKCHLGGYRDWFECPRCSKRAGILYRDEDDFACRKCLFLGYRSQKVNYQTIEPIIRKMVKLREMSPRIEWQTYRGKPTKRAMRYEKLRAKVGMGLDMLGPRYLGN